MIVRRSALAGSLLLFAAAAGAQTFPFQLTVSQGQGASAIPNGASVTIESAVGSSASAQFKITYTGTGQVVISAQSLLGSTQFTATLGGSPPVQLVPGASVPIAVQFSPTSAAAASAQLNLPYVETLPSGSSNSGTITINLAGTAPLFTLSYELQTNQNVVPLPAGGTIPFPVTLVGNTSAATLNITDGGSGPGSVANISITPGAFSLQGTPLLPATVAANSTLPISVLYTPTGAATDTGQITITLSTGSPVVINLTGNGSSAAFTYQILNATPPTSIAPGGTISFPGTQVGQSSSLSLRILNSGNAPGTVSSISAVGQGFALGPVPLPQTLAAGSSLTFTLDFTPAQPGAVTGTLIVNAVTFGLSGNGLGAQLTYSYAAGGSTVTLGSGNNSVVFSPVQVTQSEQVVLDVKNTGTLPATISNIGPGQSGGPFTVSGLPPLPVTLAPNADFHITITFAPVSVGPSTGSVIFDAASVALIGSGTAPPPLPPYTISGPSPSSPPMTQPSIGLTLASPYPVAITGTLTITIGGTLPADPAVQFATGGKTVPFVIPANQTSAVFGQLGTQIGIQSGTVASPIMLTPTFATQAANVDLTPASPPSLQFTIAPAAPVLIGAQVAALTATSFTVQVAGFTTPRSLSSFKVQFNTAAGFSMPTSQFTVDVSQLAAVWFQSTTSQAYGGQFTISVPFTFSLPTGQSIANGISSVSVTMTNATGTSNSLQATLP